MLNIVQLIGRLGRDPEVRSMASGDKVLNLSIATEDTWRDKQTGEKRSKTEWHNGVVFNERILKYLENYAQKGSMVYLAGKLRTRKWTDQQGADRFTTEIIVERFDGEAKIVSGWRESANQGERNQPKGEREDFRNADLDDEIPF